MFRSEVLPVYIKRILLFLLVLITAAVQNTVGLLPTVFGARFFPLIPLVIAIGMCDGALPGLFYGAAAGAFWDVCAFGPDGLHGLYLALIGCAAGILVRYFMKNRLLTQYCLCAPACVIYVVLYWFVSVSLPVGDAGSEKLLLFYLPSAVITAAISFITYFIVKFICSKLHEKEENIVMNGGETV